MEVVITIAVVWSLVVAYRSMTKEQREQYHRINGETLIESAYAVNKTVSAASAVADVAKDTAKAVSAEVQPLLSSVTAVVKGK